MRILLLIRLLKSTIHLLFLNHGTSLGDVDTIQKLTDILLSDVGALLNVGGRERHLVDVNARELDLILHIGGTHELDTVQKSDTAGLLFTQKVTDLDNLVSSLLDRGDIDGEMGVTESHLVLETLGDTSDHVLDVRSDGSDRSDIFSVAKPDIDLEGGTLLVHGQVHGKVLERTLEGSKRSSDGDGTALELDLDCITLTINIPKLLFKPTHNTFYRHSQEHMSTTLTSFSHGNRSGGIDGAHFSISN